MALTIDLKGQVALVTGVTSGVGLGVAKMLAKSGAAVSGCGLIPAESEKVNDFHETMQDSGNPFLYTQTDVTKDDELERHILETISRFGKIDIVVSNAGVNVFKGAAKCETDEWDYNMNLNLRSHWMISKLCQPYLEESPNGTIIIMTSNHAMATIPNCFPYNVSKTALVGLVRSLAIEWGPSIRTVGLAPGFIETPGNDKWFESFPEAQKERERTIGLHPAGRLGSTEDIGAFCAFLSSSYASFATGSTYVIDGGRLALLQDS